MCDIFLSLLFCTIFSRHEICVEPFIQNRTTEWKMKWHSKWATPKSTHYIYIEVNCFSFFFMNIIDRCKAVYGVNANEWYVNWRKIANLINFITEKKQPKWKWMDMAKTVSDFPLNSIHCVLCMLVNLLFVCVQTNE